MIIEEVEEINEKKKKNVWDILSSSADFRTLSFRRFPDLNANGGRILHTIITKETVCKNVVIPASRPF
ncbi:hypothetical protein NX021_05310 [Cytobacillus firmus]|nr:hypothetical protein [Cytobacillus firmus]